MMYPKIDAVRDIFKVKHLETQKVGPHKRDDLFEFIELTDDE